MTTQISSMSTIRFSKLYFKRLAKFTLLALILGAIGFLAGLVYLHVESFTIPNRNLPVETPAKFGLPYQDVTLQTEDDLAISAWYIPGKQPNAIILVHGIHANKGILLPEANLLAKAGYHLLLLDLRGHGESEGDEITYGYREAQDVKAAVDYLLAQPEIDHVAALGTSLGGSVIVRAAALDTRLEGLVIQSSFATMTRAVEDAYDNMAVLPRKTFGPLIIYLVQKKLDLTIDQVNPTRDLHTFAPRPILIIHGTEDEMFPIHHAKMMYTVAQEPKELWLVEGLGHGSLIPDFEVAYETHLLDFFAEVFGG